MKGDAWPELLTYGGKRETKPGREELHGCRDPQASDIYACAASSRSPPTAGFPLGRRTEFAQQRQEAACVGHGPQCWWSLFIRRCEPRCRLSLCPSTRRDTDTSTSRTVTFRRGTFWMSTRQRSKFKHTGGTQRFGHGRLAFEGRELRPPLRPEGNWFGGW